MPVARPRPTGRRGPFRRTVDGRHAATVAVKTVGVAADAAVGTAKIVGKGVGKAADAALGSDKDAK